MEKDSDELQAVRDREALFRGTFENAGVGIAHIDLDGRFLRVNQVYCSITGYSCDELLQRTFMDVTHPDEAGPILTRFQRMTRGELPGETFEKRNRRKDGSTVWVEASVSVQRNAAGDPVYCISVILDISERKRLEEELRQAKEAAEAANREKDQLLVTLSESEQRFRGTFENAAVGIAHMHPSGQNLRVNQKCCDILGYTRDELLRKSFRDLLHPDDLALSHEHFGALLRGELSAYTSERRFQRKDGAHIWSQVDVSLQRDADGNPAYAIGLLQDISERKRLDAELRRAKEAAESANRAKDEFLANVSHEIRTPMNAILGLTELVLDTSLTEDQRQCLGAVKSAGDSLLAIINDLLDFAKIEAGKLELDPADFSMRAVIGDTLRALAVRAQRKGLELVYDVAPDVPDALVGDAGRLRQVLLNLVGNAVKFTQAGEVEVRVTRDEHNGARDGNSDSSLAPSFLTMLRFTVRDTGVGISKNQQERVFHAFEQEDASTTRRYGGTGLGLSIATRLVGLMGGAIRLESAPGKGSTFAFTAQFLARDEERRTRDEQNLGSAVSSRFPPIPYSSSLLGGLRVLVVDDNATNRRILEEWLRRWQMEPTSVGDGLAAVDALWDAASLGRPYPLVLLDAHMPDADGLALAAKIRKRNELAATRIILLTSGDRPGDLARAREQRIDAHLLKPVQPEELNATIMRVLAENGPRRIDDDARRPTAESSLVSDTPSIPIRILAAEDNEFNAQLFVQLLRRHGCEVRLATDGREALRLTEEEKFDVLLLDIHMPELDGFQVALKIRERERKTGGRLPIVALTARSRQEDRERCLAVGMDDFLAKPIQAADLWSSIERAVLARKPTADSGRDLLDPHAILAACGEDAAIFEKIRQVFRNAAPIHLEAIRSAAEAGDSSRLRDAAHKFAGMASAFSTIVGDAASALEDFAAQGRLDESRPLASRLETMAFELLGRVSRLSFDELRERPLTNGDLGRTSSC